MKQKIEMGKYLYFELAEFLASDTAKGKGIDNTPTFEIVDHLNELVREVLEPLRAAWGKAIWVRSGYRCKKLNKAVGGVDTSVHQIGYAADLQTSGDIEVFFNFVVQWFRKTGTRFDQILLERDKKTGTRWIHIGLYNNAGQQRGIIKTMEVNK